MLFVSVYSTLLLLVTTVIADLFYFLNNINVKKYYNDMFQRFSNW